MSQGERYVSHNRNLNHELIVIVARSGYTFDVTYGDGSSAQGPVGIDNMSIGEAVVENMPFGICSNWTWGTQTETRDTTGQMGFGFTSLSSFQPTPQGTFMEFLQDSLEEPIFTTSFSFSTDGYLDFGFIDEKAFTGNLTSIPIDNSTGFWNATSIQYGAGGKTLSGNPTAAIFDTDSSWLYLDRSIVTAYTALVEGAKYNISVGGYVFPCKAELPDLEITFTTAEDGPAMAVIAGNLLNFQQVPSSSSDCFLAMSINTGLSILGMPFFVDRYIVWNQSEPSMAFANATGKGTIVPPASNSQATPSGSKNGGSGAGAPSSSTLSSLSTGAKAGIGVGVALGGLLLIALGVLTFRRRSKSRPSPQDAATDSTYAGKPELEGRGTEVQRSEMRGESVSEMPEKPSELPTEIRHELPADWHGYEAEVDSSR